MVLTKLYAVMTARNISTEELAASTFLSAKTIANAKTVGVSLPTCKIIAEKLGMELEELI